MMNISPSIGKILNRYGCDVTVKNGDETVKTKAFISPLRYNFNQNYESVRHKLGMRKTKLFLFIAPPDVLLNSEKSVIESKNGKYTVKGAKNIMCRIIRFMSGLFCVRTEKKRGMILNRIEKQVDRIIAGLKVNEALKNVRFIREYGSDEAPSPVNGMTAVVSVRDMSTEKSYIGGYLSPSIKGESYSAGVEIRVYAPATENGSGLSEVVSEILLGLKTADAEKTITHSEAASIEFDPDMNAIYRTVSFNMEFCLCEEV